MRFPAGFCEPCARRTFASEVVTDAVWDHVLAVSKHHKQACPDRRYTKVRWELIDFSRRIMDTAEDAYKIEMSRKGEQVVV